MLMRMYQLVYVGALPQEYILIVSMNGNSTGGRMPDAQSICWHR